MQGGTPGVRFAPALWRGTKRTRTKMWRMTKTNKDKAQQYGGFVLTFEPGRCEKIDSALRFRRHEATEPFSSVDWKFFLRELVFLSFNFGYDFGVRDRTIDGAALMERMKIGSGTGKLKMRLFSPVMFDDPVELKDLPASLRRPQLFSTSLNLRRLEQKTWRKMFDRIKVLRAQNAAALDALAKRQFEDRRIFPVNRRTERLMEQRDAIGIAVQVAGLDRPRVLKSLDRSKVDAADSALDLLDSERIQEQDAIRIDKAVFGRLLTRGMRHARFSNGRGAEVRIHVFDRKPLESVLGIDLLIYMPLYKAYILVQYKMMRRASPGKGTWYYPVDRHLMAQLSAMNRAANILQQGSAYPIPIEDWRLTEEMFFWKFCESTRASDSESSLVHGITLPRTHLESFLRAPPQRKGRSTAKRVGYENCTRYLTTSQFVDLAKAGWIGGGASARAFIERILKANRRGGRQTLLAVISQAERLEDVPRGWH